MKSRLERVVETKKRSSLRMKQDQDDRWQQIALAAYFKAEARGFIPGHELDDWLDAEREVADHELLEEELAA